MSNPHPFYDIYVSETNMAFWKVVMEGVNKMKEHLTVSPPIAYMQEEHS